MDLALKTLDSQIRTLYTDNAQNESKISSLEERILCLEQGRAGEKMSGPLAPSWSQPSQPQSVLGTLGTTTLGPFVYLEEFSSNNKSLRSVVHKLLSEVKNISTNVHKVIKKNDEK